MRGGRSTSMRVRWASLRKDDQLITIVLVSVTVKIEMIPFEGGKDGKVVLPIQVRLAPLKVCH